MSDQPWTIKTLAAAMRDTDAGTCQCDDCGCGSCNKQREAYARKMGRLLFTRDDVDALLRYADMTIEDAGPMNEGWTSDATAKSQATCRSLAARIEALLPPEIP